MSKISLKPNASGTGVFSLEAPNSNVDRTLTLPDEAGSVLTSASSITQNSGPAFYATVSADVSLTAATYTVCPLDTVEFDTDSCFDTSTYRFTPNMAGYYSFGMTFGTTNSQTHLLEILKNNTGARVIHYDFGSTRVVSNGVVFLYLNGSTDYVVFIVRTENSSTLRARDTQAFGYLVRAA